MADRDLVLDALNKAFCAEIQHTYSVTSRDYDARGGHRASAEVLAKRINNLLIYHSHIVDMVNEMDANGTSD